MSHIGSIQSGQSPEPIHPTESKAERQKLFELQWEINLIGTYVAVSRKNGHIEHQLKGIKKGMETGEKPEELVPKMNQLIDSINKEIPSNQAPFPPFDLTSSGNENQVITHYALSVGKYLNVAAEEGKMSWDAQTPLFNNTRALVDQIGTIPSIESIDRLNSIIAEANQALPLEFQLKALGK